MSGDRDITLPPSLQAAKVATRDLVKSFGGQEAASAETGKSQSRICAYGHQNMADFAPLDVIDALEDRTVGLPGWPHVTRWLCRQRGGEFVQLPDPNVSAPSWGKLVASIAKEHGELTSGVIADLDDNDISPAEARARLKDAAELVHSAVQLEHALKQRAAEED